SILIIGAGIFGATTALELRKTKSDSSVALVDRSPFPSSSTASSDMNKIVRADYQDIFYMKLALDAQQLWRSDQTYKPYYHESGMLYAENKGIARDFLRNYELINHKAAAEILTVEQARQQWCGVFRQANWTGINETYFNPHSVWGEGDGALRSVIQAALDHGATYGQASVSNLVFYEDESCKGVELEDDNGVHADHTIVATGAWTPWFLADSAPDRPSLHVGDRIITAGAIQCRAVYPYGEAQKLSEVPVIFNAQKHTEGESIPPTSDGRLKFNYEVSFTNKQFHKRSSKEISVPPRLPSQSIWSQDVPEGLKNEIRTVVHHTYGHWIRGLEIESYRMCWDAVTPNQDWIISPHPASPNLYLATGGSFHSWKSMPLLGKLVVQMLNGELPDEQAQRWAWDRAGNGGALPEFIPRRDLKDIPGYIEPAHNLP
ncbi:sarcosine oxidase, partial [Corynespora cassiicola Philippines]